MTFHEMTIAPPFHVFKGKLNWRNISADALIEVGLVTRTRYRTVERVGSFSRPGTVQDARYTDKRIEVSIVFRHTIPSSGNRLRSESRILGGSGGVEARTLSGQRRAALCRTNVTALQEMV
jgi:hypothetical protein